MSCRLLYSSLSFLNCQFFSDVPVILSHPLNLTKYLFFATRILNGLIFFYAFSDKNTGYSMLDTG